MKHGLHGGCNTDCTEEERLKALLIADEEDEGMAQMGLNRISMPA